MQLDPARYDAYPFPLVHVYREMLTAEGDPQESFRRLIKCFATALKFCSILAVNDYLNQRPEHPSSEIDSLLKTSLPRPSLGHWCQFLREIVRHLGPRLSLPQLAGFFPKTRVPGRRRTLPEELISVRNTWVHPDVRPAEGEAEKLYHANLPLLSRFLDDLDFLSEASLVGRVGGIQRRLHGSLPDSADVSLSTDFDETVEKEGAGRFGIWSQTPSGRRFLPLSVFLWLGHVSPPDSTTTQERILLFETLRSKKQIFYLLGDWYEFESDGIDEFNSLLGLLGDDETNLRILEDQRADNQASPSWQRLWVRGLFLTSQVVRQHRRNRKYLPEIYVDRTAVREEVERYLAGPGRLAVVVGRSGYGKTNLLCDLSMRLLGGPEWLSESVADALLQGHRALPEPLPGMPPTVVLHLYGREFDTPDLASRLARDLLLEEEALPGYLEELDRLAPIAGLRLLLVVDAVNEHPEGPRLFRSIDEFARRNQYPWLKVLVCVRRGFYEHISTWYDPDRTFTWFARDVKGEEVPFIELSEFTDGELEAAYEGYRSVGREAARRKAATGFLDSGREIRLQEPFEQVPLQVRILLRDPLTFRFYAQTYERAPRDLVAGKILFDRYGRFDRHHRAFLKHFIGAMWLNRTDSLADSAMFGRGQREGWQRKLVEYVLEDPLSSGWVTVCDATPPPGAPSCPDGPVAYGPPPDKPACERCGGPAHVENRKELTAYDFFRDNGVISEYKLPDHTYSVRFTYDRFFETALAVHLFVDHRQRGLTPIQRAAEMAPALASPQLRDALLGYLLLLVEYQVAPGGGEGMIETLDQLYVDCEWIAFARLESEHQSADRIEPLLLALLQGEHGDDAVGFVVDAIATFPRLLAKGQDCLLSRLFSAERARPKHLSPGRAFDVATRAARETERVDLLVDAIEWGRPTHSSRAVEELYLTCARGLEAGPRKTDAGPPPLTTLLAQLQRRYRGLVSIFLRRKGIKANAELLLRLVAVHFERHDQVVEPVVSTLTAIAGSLPLVGRSRWPWLSRLAWPLLRLVLWFAAPILLLWIRRRLQAANDRSPFLKGMTFEEILSPGPEDREKLLLALNWLGPDAPAPQEFWDRIREFAQPQRGVTTLPSVKTGISSPLMFARCMAEFDGANEQMRAIAEGPVYAYFYLAVCKLLSFVARARGTVPPARLLEASRHFFRLAEQRAPEEFFRSLSFAGLENYPVHQFTLIEMAARKETLDYAGDHWRAGLAGPDPSRLAFVLHNLLATSTIWPTRVLAFLSARLAFAEGHLDLLGSSFTILLPGTSPSRQDGGQAKTVLQAENATAIIRPLQELLSALHVTHRNAVRDYMLLSEIPSAWKAFLLGEQRHERLERFHSTSSLGQFFSMTAQRSEELRRLLVRLLEIVFERSRANRFRPMNARTLRRIAVDALAMLRDEVGKLQASKQPETNHGQLQ